MWQCIGFWRQYCSCRCSRWSSRWGISSQNVWVPKLWEAIWSKTLLLWSIIKYFHSSYRASANFCISFINTFTFQNDGFHRSRLQVLDFSRHSHFALMSGFLDCLFNQFAVFRSAYLSLRWRPSSNSTQ